jgi:hypothetical protein
VEAESSKFKTNLGKGNGVTLFQKQTENKRTGGVAQAPIKKKKIKI